VESIADRHRAVVESMHFFELELVAVEKPSHVAAARGAHVDREENVAATHGGQYISAVLCSPKLVRIEGKALH
jgi:hypothetical protein